MRLTILLAAAGALILAALFAAQGRDTPAKPAARAAEVAHVAPGLAAPPPASLIGRKVRVYFRRSDEISSPAEDDGKLRLLTKLEYLGGTVVGVHPGWIELTKPADGGKAERPNVWIPAPSVAYVIADEALEPKTRP